MTALDIAKADIARTAIFERCFQKVLIKLIDYIEQIKKILEQQKVQ